MLTQKRTAVPVLAGLEHFLKRRPDARILVRFIGPRESINDEETQRRGLDGVVEFHDTVSHADSLKLERRSHILLLVKHSNPLYKGIVPGKLYEYVGARRPILAVVPNGEAKEIVTGLRRGETAPPDDPAAIAQALDVMYAKYEAGTLEVDYDLSVVAEFQRQQRTARLAELLSSLQAGGTGRGA
jgi:glycosyltransferase involved in cell wall biosynthesis